jgi:hypothetical protein
VKHGIKIFTLFGLLLVIPNAFTLLAVVMGAVVINNQVRLCLCPIGMLHRIYVIIRIYMTFRAKPVQL